MKRLVCLLAAAVTLAACGRGSSAPSDSGVQGIVLIGPMCPVVVEGSPCPDRPFAATIVVKRDGDEVTTVESGKDGRFRVALEPGDYALEASGPNPGAPPTARPVSFTVKPHAFTQVTVNFDSGIR